LKNFSYEQRLQILDLTTLEKRRLRGDLIETYKILTRAMRRRTGGGRRRRWVVLWPAASAASDQIRLHWNSALAGQAFFPGFTGSVTSPVISAGLLAPKS